MDEQPPDRAAVDRALKLQAGSVLAREVERLRAIEARAREVAFHDGPMFTAVRPPELHWIGQYVLKGDPD